MFFNACMACLASCYSYNSNFIKFKSYYSSGLYIIFVNFYLILFLKYVYRNDMYATQIMVAYTGLIYRKVSEKEMNE